jgi:hypothetical protein
LWIAAYFKPSLREKPHLPSVWHSAKQHKHSANPLPSVALGKEETAKKESAKASLPSVFYRALHKDFAECLILLSAKKMDVTAEETVTDVCRVPERSTRQSVCSLPSAGVVTLGKAYALCRVLVEWHSAKV